jgi:diguanylate cyclase (GGDEF)-like protein
MHEDLIKSVLACQSLPSLPAVAVRVLEQTRDPDMKLTEIAATIQHDQGLSSRILRTVNSSFYGLRKGCSTISHALIMLGLNPVKTLALGFSLSSAIKKGIKDPFDHITYWRRGLYSASAAHCLATAARCGEPEEAFLAALLQDVGMVGLHHALGEEYMKVLARAEGDHRALLDIEQEALGVTHPEVGAEMCAHWRLPQELVTPIRHHERPQFADQEPLDIVRCVGVANLIAEALIEHERSITLFRQIYSRCESWFNMTGAETDDIFTKATEQTHQLGPLFDVDTGEYPDVESILETANKTLIDISLQTSQRASDLTEQNEQLRQQVDHDALTGTATRHHFRREIVDAYEKARQGGSVAVIFIDADHFKSINDAYGHLVGDAVLVELAQRLKTMFDSTGLVCRYGGEEFAVIIRNTSRVDCAKMAEQARDAIASTPVDLAQVPDAPKSVSVTASMGVAHMDEASVATFTSYTQLVSAADRAVYAAKQAGRNCVRVFKAKSASQSKTKAA